MERIWAPVNGIVPDRRSDSPFPAVHGPLLFCFFVSCRACAFVRVPGEMPAVGVLSLSFLFGYFDHQLRANVGGRAGFRGMRFGLAFRRGVVDSSVGWMSLDLENWSQFLRVLSSRF